MIEKAIEYMKEEHCKRCKEGICIPDCPYKLAIESMTLRVAVEAKTIGPEYRCPTCNKRVKFKHSNCKRCGQSLKWEV